MLTVIAPVLMNAIAPVNLALVSILCPMVVAVIGKIKIHRSLGRILFLLSAFSSIWLFYSWRYPQVVTLYSWFTLPAYSVKYAISLDAMSVCLNMMVTTVAAAIYHYSFGYFTDYKETSRFLRYLGLFVFMMLVLVFSANLLSFFLGWEGIGFCSYLMINFWYKKEKSNFAALQAFIMNRIGDAAFVVGMVCLYATLGSLDFNELTDSRNIAVVVALGAGPALKFACLCLFIGCMAKSAQLIFFPWLRDAMAGPTPASALIHAATMVTAGVILMARLAPIFSIFPDLLAIVKYVGLSTAVLASFIALTQNDIKKVVAFSTCSQLGYMFFACGLQSYAGALFHLFTHAFFKSLLFLVAANIIHFQHGEQRLSAMKAVKVPFTMVLMLIGTLAICGIYPFSGFYSKEAITEAAYINGEQYDFGIFLAVIFLTSLYSWRLVIKVFRIKGDAAQSEHAIPSANSHSSKIAPAAVIALVVLAFFACVAGWWGQQLHMTDAASWGLSTTHSVSVIAPSWLHIVPLWVSLLGSVTAFAIYIPSFNFSVGRSLYKFFEESVYLSNLYQIAFVRPYKGLAQASAKFIEPRVFDAPARIATDLSWKLARTISCIHTGYISHYTLAIVVCTLLLMLFKLYKF